MRISVQGIILLLVCGVFGDKEKPVSVMEGDFVTLHTNTSILTKDKILWRFEKKGSFILLVEIINYNIKYDSSIDKRFSDRLLISDTQSGDLLIENMRVKYSGLYEAEIQTATGTSHKKFNVTVKESPRYIAAGPSDVKSVSVKEGDSVTLPSDEQTQRGDLILWRFGDKNLLIAKGDMEDNKISYDDDDGRFSGRLKLDKSGDLTIINIRTSNTGVYNLKIISNRETKYKTFTVSVSGGGLSSGAVAGICISLVIAAFIPAGVFVYLRKKQPVTISASEEDSVTLPGADSELEPETRIELKFKDLVIIRLFKTKDKVIHLMNTIHQRFKDRLELSKNGHIKIKKISKEDAGIYELNIANNRETLHFKIEVTVIDKTFQHLPDDDPGKLRLVPEEETLTLVGSHIGTQTGTRIEWMFKGRVIMIGETIDNNRITEIYNDDQQFKDRLELNPHFGHLIIKPISKEDTGLYEVKVSHNKLMLSSRFEVKVIEKALQHLPVDVTGSEGDCVTLPGAYSRPGRGSQIEWTFEDRVIMTGEMKIKGMTGIHSDDQQFKDRLGLDYNFGSLFIHNISKKDAGIYEGKITNVTKPLHFKIKVNVIGGSPKEDLNRQTGDSARTYRNDPGVDIPLLEKV